MAPVDKAKKEAQALKVRIKNIRKNLVNLGEIPEDSSESESCSDSDRETLASNFQDWAEAD